MSINDKQYITSISRGHMIKVSDDGLKAGEYVSATYQDVPEVELKLMLIGNQTKDDKYVIVRVNDNYRYDENTIKKFLLERIDDNQYRIHTRRYHNYPWDDPKPRSEGNPPTISILKNDGIIKIIDDQNGFYYGYSYDAIIENKDYISCDYVSMFYSFNRGDIGFIYLWEEKLIAIVKRVNDNLYKTVKYLDDFNYSSVHHDLKNLVCNEKEGYIEFDLYVTYSYPSPRLVAHKKHYFKVVD